MKEFIYIMPEIFLALTLVAVVIGEITYHGEKTRLISPTALVGLGGAFIQTIITYQFTATQVFNATLSVDGFALFFKLLFISLAALAIITSMQSKEIASNRWAEYCSLILAATLAMCLASSSVDILLTFLSLQFLNVVVYFLAGYGKRSVLSTEAAVKYMAFGAVAASLLLYGLAILFAATHALNLYEIHRALMAASLSRESLLVIFMLVFLALSFQFGAFPMYLWAPDVLEGAPTPVSAFIAVGCRAAGFAVALRFMIGVFAQPALFPNQWQPLGGLDWTPIVELVSGMTMMVGALLAFRQTAAKRMVSCLVVAQTGYLLIGLLVLDEIGVAALLYNLVVELFAIVGSFYVLSFLVDELHSDRLDDLKGMLKRAVPECICLVLFLVCLVGLPPMPGFIGKFTLIGSAIRHQRVVLAVVAIASMALSAVAVGRLAYSLTGDFKKASAPPVAPSVQRQAFLTVLVLPMLLVGLFAEFVLNWAGRSLGFIFW